MEMGVGVTERVAADTLVTEAFLPPKVADRLRQRLLADWRELLRALKKKYNNVTNSNITIIYKL
jgi:hypothetical protein